MEEKKIYSLTDEDIVVVRDIVKTEQTVKPEESADGKLKLLGEVPSVDRPDPNCDTND